MYFKSWCGPFRHGGGHQISIPQEKVICHNLQCGKSLYLSEKRSDQWSLVRLLQSFPTWPWKPEKLKPSQFQLVRNKSSHHDFASSLHMCVFVRWRPIAMSPSLADFCFAFLNSKLLICWGTWETLQVQEGTWEPHGNSKTLDNLWICSWDFEFFSLGSFWSWLHYFTLFMCI